MAGSTEAPRTCKACGNEKAADQFRLFGRGRKKVCITCEPSPPPKAGAKRKSSKKKGARRKAAATAPVSAATLTRPAGFGIEASLQEAEQKGQNDILLKQTGSALGEQVIWINPHEARELHAWLGERLAAP